MNSLWDVPLRSNSQLGMTFSFIPMPPSRYNSRRNDDYAALLTFPKIRTKKTLADRSFSCAAPRLWNLLPTTIRSTSSLYIFKIRLKTFLFNRAFN